MFDDGKLAAGPGEPVEAFFNEAYVRATLLGATLPRATHGLACILQRSLCRRQKPRSSPHKIGSRGCGDPHRGSRHSETT